MYEFSYVATKLLKEYKLLIKKHFPEESTKKLSELGLDKKLPGRENALYQLTVNVLNKANLDTQNVNTRLRYSGTHQFLQHMKDIIAVYRVEKGRVIHTTKTAANAMIQSIQFMSLPDEKLTMAIAAQLKDFAAVVAKYGLEEQKTLFLSSLNSNLPRNADFFTPILEHYRDAEGENSALLPYAD